MSDSVVLTPFSEVAPESMHWLWPGRIPLGKLTLLAGDPGLGKSFLTLDLAARLSRAHDLPDARNPFGVPVRSVILSAEDDPADTIRPRLDSMGADPSMIYAVRGVRYGPRGERMPRLDRDLYLIEQAIKRFPGVRLIVVDPISAYLGDADANSNAEVRTLLGAMAAIASANKIAIVLVTHLNKSQQTRTMYRAMGSLAFTAAARVVLAVVKDTVDPDRRILAPVKANVAARTDALAYRLTDGRVAYEPATITTTIEDLERPIEPEELGESRDATTWLRNALAEGAVDAKTLRENAERDGVSWRTLQRVKEALGVRAIKESFKGAWRWSLPGTPTRDGIPEEERPDMVGSVRPHHTDENGEPVFTTSQLAQAVTVGVVKREHMLVAAQLVALDEELTRKEEAEQREPAPADVNQAAGNSREELPEPTPVTSIVTPTPTHQPTPEPTPEPPPESPSESAPASAPERPNFACLADEIRWEYANGLRR